MNSLLDKCRIIYKGDYFAGSFYLFLGVIMLVISFVMDRWWTQFGLGFHIMSIGTSFLAAYALAKGTYIVWTSLQKYKFFMNLESFSFHHLKTEISQTEYRIQKKKINRRRYIYMTIIASIFAFLGMFSSSKAMIMGTAIPIALISGIEFSIGLLTEFRLSEYLRQLQKHKE